MAACCYAREGDELSLAFRDLERIPDAVAEAEGPHVRSLDLTETGIRSLAALDKFPRLAMLVLDKNGLPGLGDCPRLEALETLWFNNNAVADLVAFVDEIASRCPRLTYLSAMRNPACPGLMDVVAPDEDAVAMYRRYVLHRLPRLECLDAARVTPAERAEAAVRGKFAAVRRPKGAAPPSGDVARRPSAGDDEPNPFAFVGAVGAPGPAAPLRGAKKTAFQAKNPSTYNGRHSEGNRFIRNEVL